MPTVYVIGGPNGAGKTTVALRLFPDALASKEFVNADFIAQGLSAFDTESVAIAAGRLLLQRIHDLKARGKDFAFESTLASRSFVPFLRECKQEHYNIALIYVWIEGADLARQRIRERVAQGGHSIPDEVVRRRYERSTANLVNLYLPLADSWRIYDNTPAIPRLVAFKDVGRSVTMFLPKRMEKIMSSQVREPEEEYVPNKIDLAVKAAVADELERKRKLGLPIVIGRDGKVIIMIGDKVVEEIEYGSLEKGK